MKVSQIAVGCSYEDKQAETIRKVSAVHSVGSNKVVEYTERSPFDQRPLYLPLRRATRDLPLSEFAEWAARPAGAKNPFKNWKGGPINQFAKR